ncbi:MAG: RNA polymerase subunit sigma [Oscillospiraceae bacterium]|nr:RNA polymerase subunit sigma [Oscillospiraceae bacterium]MCR5307283.1 RNA polymerase subunit sigma [Oscillospiraceae bacterium]
MDSDAQRLPARVSQAKHDSQAADALIADYMPFIRAETARFLKRQPNDGDDELSIAMFAFYESIRSYSGLRGSFLKFASVQIKSRLIDYYRKEKRSRGQISLYSAEDGQQPLMDTLPDKADAYEELELRDATRQEIEELSAQMQQFGVSLPDISENSPKQQRTLEICQRAIRYARGNPSLLEEFLRTKRVPLQKLAEGAAVERKTLERHRQYLVAVLLICTNGYEILRGHIMQVLRKGDQP